MKNKTVTIILSSLLIVSIGINIWQYSKTNSLNASVATLQDDIQNLKAETDSQNSEISAKDEEIANLSTSVEQMKVENENLKTAIDDAAAKDAQIAELNATIEELKAEIEALKKASTTKPAPSSQPQQPNTNGGTGNSQTTQPSTDPETQKILDKFREEHGGGFSGTIDEGPNWNHDL